MVRLAFESAADYVYGGHETRAMNCSISTQYPFILISFGFVVHIASSVTGLTGGHEVISHDYPEPIAVYSWQIIDISYL